MKIDNASLKNSAEITSAIFDNYYQNGEMIVKNTSFAKEGVYGRTLTSRSVTDLFNGDAIYRDAKFSLTFLNRNISSSLNSVVTGGAESVFDSPNSLKIKSPENLGEDSDETTLTGGVALNRIAASSGISRKGAGEFISASSAIALADMTNIQKDPEYIAAIPHGDSEYTPDAGAVGSTTITTYSRTIVLDSIVTQEEKSWIIERGTLLKGKGVVKDAKYLVNGFPFDIPDGIQELKQTETYYQGMADGNSVEQTLVDAPQQLAYICPAMIELLIYLESKMSYKGSLGAERATNPYGQTINNGTPQKGTSLNDHVFGRAFDLIKIESRDGNVSVNFKNEGTNIQKYREGLNHFLAIMNAAPIHLKPDLIVVSSDLAPELGIVPGFETLEAAVKKQYPNLRYVNFRADTNHKNNIHFSFSAQRSGQYIGSGGAMGLSGQFIAPAPIASGGYGASPPADLSSPKFTDSYANNVNGSFTRQEIFDLLRGTVMSDEAAAVFVAVAARESGNKPSAFNPNAVSGAGDWSLGLFQVNFLPKAHGTKTFYFPIGDVSKPGYQFAYKDWQQAGATADNFRTIAINAYNGAPGGHGEKVTALRPRVDPLSFVPLNQASMVYTAIKSQVYVNNMPFESRMGSTPETGYIFQPWGDYNGGPPYGFISNVFFKDAIDAYLTTGKDPKLLRQWVLSMFATDGAGTKSAQYAAEWVEGWYFDGPYTSSGWQARGKRREHTSEELYPPGVTYPGVPPGGGAQPGIVPIYDPGVVPDPGRSEGTGGLNRSGLNGKLALSYARWCVGKFKYAAVNPYRFGEVPWTEPLTKTDIRGNPVQWPVGTLVFDCSGFVVAVYRKAGLDFGSEFQLTSSDGFAKSLLPNAPRNALQPLDIICYKASETTSNTTATHVLLVNQVKPDGTVETIESTPSLGVGYRTIVPGRIIAAKRILRTGYFL